MKTYKVRSALISSIIALAVPALCPAVRALPSLELSPPTQNANAGGTFDLSVRIAGLGDQNAPSLGTFDLDVLFDPLLVQFDSAVFGTFLGSSIDGVTPGAADVNLFSVSLETPDSLNATQPADFALAILHFTALAGGVANFSLDNIVLGDAVGLPLTLTAASGASVTISQAVPDALPAWATVLPFGILLAQRHLSRQQKALRAV